MIRLLAIDIDGTLLDSRGRLPDAHRVAVMDAAATGVEIALATGRSFHFAKPIADLLSVPLTLVVNNGAVVKNGDGQSMMRHTLSRDVARDVLNHATPEYADSVALVFDYHPGGDSFGDASGHKSRQVVFEHMDWTRPNRRGYYEKNKQFIALADGPLQSALVDDPIQVMFNGGVERMRELAGSLRALPSAPQMTVAVTEYEFRDFSLVDINGPRCSKGTTLARWAESRGWSRDQVMAVGDNLNDIEMLDFAGLAFVMDNGVPEMKARGYQLTRSNDHDGLASAIHRGLFSGSRVHHS